MVEGQAQAQLPRAGSRGSSPVNAALERWRAELLDLSKANRLLYLRPGRGVLPLTHPTADLLFDGLENQEPTYTFYQPDEEDETAPDEQLALFLAEEPTPPGNGETSQIPETTQTIQFKGAQRPGAGPSEASQIEVTPPVPEPRPPRPDEIVVAGEPKKIEAALYRLRLRARSALVEQGINVLFVTFGTLEWSEAPASDISIISPLILVPVSLERATALDPYTLKPLDDTIIFNPALARRLEVDFKLRLDLPDDSERDLTLQAALDHIRQAVAGRPSWKVHAEVYLGLFSYAKYAMYTDLAMNHARFTGHPLVRVVAGEDDGLPEPIGDLPTAEQLDEHVTPAEVFQVLDADASQMEAIAAVKAGASLVIQGPPGTGKSQTIANIIAEMLAQGQTVLFVSEKMAALRVVAKRLAAAGLSEFCLEAHSQDVNKAAIVRELKVTLDKGRSVRADTAGLDLERLALLRRQLNAYVRAVHSRHNPLGRSAFQIHGEIARRRDAPVILCDLPDAGTLTLQRLTELIDLVQQLVRVGDVLLRADEHPWHGCLVPSVTPQVQAELDSRLRQLAATTDDLAAAQARLRTAWGLPPEASLPAAEWLRDLLTILDDRADVPSHWLRSPSLGSHITTANEYRQRIEEYRRRRAAVLENYTETVFALDLPTIQRDLEGGGAPQAGRLRGDGAPADRALARRAEVTTVVNRAGTALDAVDEISHDVAEQLGLTAPTSLTQARNVQAIAALVMADPRPGRDWFAPGRLVALEELATEAGRQQEAVTTGRAAVSARFEDEFFEVATAEFAGRFEDAYASWLRIFRPDYHRDAGRLRRLLKERAGLGYGDALAALRQARRVATARTWLDDHRAELVAGLGHHFAGARTPWEAVIDALATVRDLTARLATREPPARMLDLLVGGPAALKPYATAFEAALDEADHAWADLTRVISLDALPFGGLPGADVPLAELAAWLRTWLQALAPLWAAAEALSAHRSTGALSVADMAADAREVLALRTIEAELAAASDDLRATYGHLFTGLETRWEVILNALGWTGRLLEHFAGPPPAAFIDVLAAAVPAASPERPQMIAGIGTLTRLIEELRPLFTGPAYQIGPDPLSRAALNDIAAWGWAKRAALSQLEEWVDLAHVRAEADTAGLTSFVDGLVRERPALTTWRDAFLRQAYTLWLTAQYEREPALARFRGQQHEAIAEEFRQLDRWQWQAAARRIAQRLVPKRPAVELNIHPRSEPALLIKEASKRRRFRPLRKLFADLPHLLPALKPCLLMSPLSVAQFLGESAMTFDVVIFDEASQILPADAIGAIGRGRQLVVVGDQQQLPPTRFFSVDIQPADEGEDDEEVPESILDACIAGRLPSRPLLWHYRSRHEHLIAFSNRWFYDRRLITFPSPDEHERAVEFIHVADGVYERGAGRINRAEARRIADLVVAHVEHHRGQSLGVIAFSEAQRDAILADLEVRKRARPELEGLLSEEGLEGFFVKNLENVQGDERDVIFFSVGYGPDQAGHMTMNFGPLNSQGGERRLNVAVTRARDRIKTLASFLPHAIDRGRTQAKGVHLLRSYLEFAEQGPQALLGEITVEGGEPESPFESAVVDALTARGLRVVSQVGVGAFRIDLGIEDEMSDRYLLGIECDGAAYHSSKTARDRDRLRQQVLEHLGWRIHRIWSTDWIKDAARETAKVLAAVEHARADIESSVVIQAVEPVAAMPPDESGTNLPMGDHAGAAIVPDGAPARHAPVAHPYVAAILPPQGNLDTLRLAPIDRLARLVQFCAQAEGPVHQNRVMRTVAASFGIARVGHQVRLRLLAAIEQSVASGAVVRRDEFLWPATMSVPAVRAADAEGVVRAIREVAPEEIATGVRLFLERAFSINRDDLITGLARELGYDRTGSQVAAAIGDVVDQMIAGGALLEAGGQVRLS